MKINRERIIFLTATVFVLTLSLFVTMPAYADDGTPPVPTDVPVVATDEPVSTDAAPTQVAAATDEASVTDILAQVPQGTDVVALNQTGQVEPLASQAAANIIVSGDPMWCPNGTLPGGAGCTIAHPSFTALLNDLQANNTTYTGNGTIYIASNYDAATAGDTGAYLTFYGATAGSGSDTGLVNLVVQGGWDFGTNTKTGTSTINMGSGSGLDFNNIGGSTNYTMNDLIFQNSDLYVSSSDGTTGLPSGNVTLNNVTNNGGMTGLHGKNVTVNNSSFSNSPSTGLDIGSTGNVVLNNVTSSNNSGDGTFVTGSLDMNTMQNISPNVTVNGGNFNNNGGSGLNVDANYVTLNGVTSTGNANPDSIIGSPVPATGETDSASSSRPSESSPLAAIQPEPITSLDAVLALLPPGTTLPEGTNLVAGFSVQLPTDANGNVIPGQVTFTLPDGVSADNLAVLFWDGTGWATVPATVVNGQVMFTAAAAGVYVLGSAQ